MEKTASQLENVAERVVDRESTTGFPPCYGIFVGASASCLCHLGTLATVCRKSFVRDRIFDRKRKQHPLHQPVIKATVFARDSVSTICQAQEQWVARHADIANARPA